MYLIVVGVLTIPTSGSTQRPRPAAPPPMIASPQQPREYASQEAGVSLKFHMVRSSGSVHHSFCGAEPTQKLSFVGQTEAMNWKWAYAAYCAPLAAEEPMASHACCQ